MLVRITGLVLWLAMAVGPAFAEPLPRWCDAACARLFAPQPIKPDCSLTTFDHQVMDGRIERVVVPDRECEDLVAAWEQHSDAVKQSREGLLDREGCLAWCNEVGTLRGSEPIPEEARQVWQLLADIEVCSTGELDGQFVGLVPLQFRCSGMAYVPQGKFMMGCADSRRVRCKADEQPLHLVYLSGFLIDLHEVTVAAYARCVRAHRCKEPKDFTLLRFFNWGNPERLLHPVNGVTYQQAVDYCRFDGKRLCTEAEWEKAARGTDGRLYPWGNWAPTPERALIDDGIDYSDENRKWPVLTYTEQVCSRPGGNSPYGLCDMAGNVAEWVADWYAADTYQTSPLVNPTGPETGTHRVIRSGRFARVGFSLRAASRRSFAPDKDFEYLGFRCCQQFGQTLDVDDDPGTGE
jgi:formylglycine-generating enzyme required for sulfatase activity